jgi:crotonobetainyl-CoA:carnitine CoA-transferase CaiB-like acyl-CoA transferase
MSAVEARRDTKPPRLGEHTASVLAAELGLSAAEIESLHSAGVVA